MSNKVIVLIVSTLLLAACGSIPQHKAATPPVATTVPGSGGYLEGDGPGADAPANIDAIPDAVPKNEPLHRYANRPYKALDKAYTPLTITGAFKEHGIASWYGKKFNGQRTSSGETYDMYSMSAAHPTLPIPSYARVTNLANQKSVIVRINDRGPFINDRIIDLSYTAAHKLGIVGSGSAEVEVESIAATANVNSIASSNVQSQPLPPAAPVTATPAATIPAASAVIAAPVATAPTATAPITTPLVATASPAGNDAGVYLQLGAFSSQAGAEAYLDTMRGKLGDTGKQLKLSSKDGLVRVHIGPYANQSEARGSAEEMESKLGFKPMVNLP